MGFILLLGSLVMLCVALILIVKILSSLMKGKRLCDEILTVAS